MNSDQRLTLAIGLMVREHGRAKTRALLERAIADLREVALEGKTKGRSRPTTTNQATERKTHND